MSSSALEDTMELPEAAVDRIALFAAISNVELAKLSNISQQWRKVVKKLVLEQALNKITGTSAPPLLLLPSIVRHLILIQEGQRSTEKADNLCFDETFCAAWFHPDGIQEKKFNFTESDDTEQDVAEEMAVGSIHTQTTEPFVPNLGEAYQGSDTELKRRPNNRKAPVAGPTASSASAKRPSPKVETDPNYVSCADEWRGLRSPMQVLKHFGYTPAFVNYVLRIATESMDTDDGAPSYADDLLDHMEPHQPTFAVRGATIARPESYCLCLDVEKQNVDEFKAATVADGASKELAEIRVQEFRQLRARRQKRRRELQRDVLPRVLTRIPASVKDSDSTNSVPTIGRQQRSVQFLNAEGSHAVCMMTPHFACGPLTEPVTIFCVGIATEDGCFLSGLHHRFELGHLYPNGPLDEVTELSPVCIATDTWQMEAPKPPDQDAAASAKDDDEQAFRLSASDGDDDSSYDFSGDEGSSSFKCECIFQGIGDKLEELDDDTNRKVQRGKRGPGAWHCYVAVVDDEQSMVRIDGLAEPLKADDSPTGAHPAMLDGLTIGSDHCFGMSLCCGHGSGGEGEGAIAELAVFRGRLDVTDIECIERQLMNRHGILPLHHAVANTVWRADTWERQAQALFWQTSDNDWNFDQRVPLRIMARHRSVAWKQQSPVTGKEVRIQKIGSRPGASSSDW